MTESDPLAVFSPVSAKYGSYKALRETLDLPVWTPLRQKLWELFPTATTVDIDLFHLQVLRRWAHTGREKP